MDTKEILEFIDEMIERKALKIEIKDGDFETKILFDPNRFADKVVIDRMEKTKDKDDEEMIKFYNPTVEDLKIEGIL